MEQGQAPGGPGLSRRKQWWAGVLAMLVVVLVVLPWARDREDRSLDAERETYRSKGHTFAETKWGVLHYELRGPDDGDLVILIHGVSGPQTVWDHAVPRLVEAGHRVLRYDHPGRGLSDRVDRPYDMALFEGAIEELHLQLAPDSKAHLVGSSMGAIVAAEYAARHPYRVRSVTLIGPAGFPLEASPLAKLMDVPVVSTYLMKVVGDDELAEHNRNYFHDPAPHADFQRAFEEQLRFEGSKQAILSTLQNMPVQSYLEGYLALAETELPVLVVWGRQDAAFPFEHHAELKQVLPDAKLHAIDQAGHLPMVERAEVVTPMLLEFLAR